MADRDGLVVTFYSYTGGTGKTMAIANVAWILAANGKKVLVADWDIESPGLHRFFGPFLDADTFAQNGGVIDLIREFEWATIKETDRSVEWFASHASLQSYAFGLRWTFPSGGTLDFLSAGRQNNDYAASIQALDWDVFYEHRGGGQFLDAVRADMKYHYDYALIDSRPGVSDVAEICTIQLPDVLVACFVYSEQSIMGTAQVSRSVLQRYDPRDIRILPLPSRVDPTDEAKVARRRDVAMEQFLGLPAVLTPDQRSTYWATIAIPYKPSYAYEEILSPFAERAGEPGTLLAAYENLTAYITSGEVTSLPPMPEAARRRFETQFARKLTDPDGT